MAIKENLLLNCKAGWEFFDRVINWNSVNSSSALIHVSHEKNLSLTVTKELLENDANINNFLNIKV